jgi:5,10-methylenetetrahydrofolate reductase
VFSSRVRVLHPSQAGFGEKTVYRGAPTRAAKMEPAEPEAASFGPTLRSLPLLFEPVPPPARTSAARFEERVLRVAEIIGDPALVDGINVPELIDENHDGHPYYRSSDPRAFAQAIAAHRPVELAVNKVVAHTRSVDLERWAAETVASGVRHLVLVGGSSRYIPYPGPSVPEANHLLRPLVEQAGGALGNITIPQRVGEAHRMLAKTRAGASFFTTQLVFDANATAETLRGYDRLCREVGIAPATVLLSFAPLADESDAEFVRWLGADLPEEAERSILGSDDAEATPRSIERALSVWSAVCEAREAAGGSVPLGVNVEQVSSRHLEAAAGLLKAFSEHVGPRCRSGRGPVPGTAGRARAANVREPV